MEKNQKGFLVLVAVVIIVAMALIGGAAYFYFFNKNNIKSQYTDQGNIEVQGELIQSSDCDFQITPEFKDGENRFAGILVIRDSKNKCEEIKQYAGKKVRIKGRVFGQSFSEPCSCIPIGYIENIERISLSTREICGWDLLKSSADKSEIKKQSQADDETANWQTYLNKEWGIEIKYPDSWLVQGAEIHDQNSDAYLAISLLENPQNLSFADWWEKNMIIGGRPTALYKSENTTVGGVKAKIAYTPEGESGWHVHIADDENQIFSLFAQGSDDGKQVFDQMLSTFKFIGENSSFKENIVDLKDGKGKASGYINDIYYKNGEAYIDINLVRWFNGLGDCLEIKEPNCAPINFYTSYYAEGQCGAGTAVSYCGPNGIVVIDESKKITTFKIAKDAIIMVVHLGKKGDYDQIGLDKFIEFLNTDSNEESWPVEKNGIFHFEIDKGFIVKIIHQYHP